MLTAQQAWYALLRCIERRRSTTLERESTSIHNTIDTACTNYYSMYSYTLWYSTWTHIVHTIYYSRQLRIRIVCTRKVALASILYSNIPTLDYCVYSSVHNNFAGCKLGSTTVTARKSDNAFFFPASSTRV